MTMNSLTVNTGNTSTSTKNNWIIIYTSEKHFINGNERSEWYIDDT